jgi:hypothetical protein
MSERFFDELARTLAAPMPRRRALRLAGVTLAAAAVPGLRPRFARGAAPACGGLTPQKCVATAAGSNGNRAQVCIASDGVCCSNDLCAIGCNPWESCSPGQGCDDTRLLCTDPRAAGIRGGGNPKGRPKFCSTRLKSGPSVCYPNGRELTWGWCCQAGETCGSKINDCSCEGTVCGAGCCKSGEECVNPSKGLCCPKGWTHCDVGAGASAVACCPPTEECCFNRATKTAVCCDGDHPCKNGKCTCAKGEEPCGATCCKPGHSCVSIGKNGPRVCISDD